MKLRHSTLYWMNLGIITHRYNNSLSSVHHPFARQISALSLVSDSARQKVGTSKIQLCRFALFYPCAWPIPFCLLTGWHVLAGENTRIPPLLPLWRIPDTITRQVFRPDSSRDSSTCSTSSSFPFYNSLCLWSVQLFYNNFLSETLFPIYCLLAVNCGLCLE